MLQTDGSRDGREGRRGGAEESQLLSLHPQSTQQQQRLEGKRFPLSQSGEDDEADGNASMTREAANDVDDTDADADHDGNDDAGSSPLDSSEDASSRESSSASLNPSLHDDNNRRSTDDEHDTEGNSMIGIASPQPMTSPADPSSIHPVVAEPPLGPPRLEECLSGDELSHALDFLDPQKMYCGLPQLVGGVTVPILEDEHR